MTTTQKVSSRTFTQSDLKLVNDIIYKSADDICVSIARSFERMEERIEAMESRLYSRLADLEDLLTEIRADETKQKKSLPLASAR